jgi:hypothetical protein
MGRRRKQIFSGRLYEFVLRAKSGLPFPPKRIIHAILRSAMARAQRDEKVDIVAYLWMGNHLHVLFVSKDRMQATRFYGEIKKKITESMKALLGLHQLNLWDADTSLVAVLDAQVAITRIAYFFCNPAKADLVDSIREYPGLSSWEAFNQNLSGPVNAKHTIRAPWIRLPTIETLASKNLSDRQDSFITQKLLAAAKKTHEIVAQPNLWLKCFGITEPADVARANKAILRRVELGEEQARALRESEGKSVIGAEKLTQVCIMAPHIPKRDPNERRIYFVTSSPTLAFQFKEQFRIFCDKCREVYQKLRRGEYKVEWPPGAIPAAAPPTSNWF